MDFPIDCQTFLRLTGEKLGASRSGLYVIKQDGIELWKDGIETSELAKSWGETHTDALLLDLIDAARLPFPTTAKNLVAWQEKNKEFEIPDWLKRVVNADQKESAVVELERADKEYKARQDAAARKLVQLKIKRRKPGVWYPVEIEWNRLLGMRVAVEQSLAQITSTPPTKTNSNSSSNFSSISQIAQAGGIAKRNKSPKQKAKEGAFELWKERHGGKHPNLRTVNQFAMEVMRRWPVLTSQKVICGWSAAWTKDARKR